MRGVALVENTDFTTGTDEFTHLADYLTRRGIRAVVADPRELRLAGGGLRARGVPVDLVYRDPETDEWVVVDYKTDREVPRDGDPKFAAYAAQGRVYQRAVREALALSDPPRFELWYLRRGEIVAL